MSKEIIQSAAEVVYQHEVRYLQELYQWKKDAERRAKECGCPQCTKEPGLVDKLIAYQLESMNHSTHEEFLDFKENRPW